MANIKGTLGNLYEWFRNHTGQAESDALLPVNQTGTGPGFEHQDDGTATWYTADGGGDVNVPAATLPSGVEGKQAAKTSQGTHFYDGVEWHNGVTEKTVYGGGFPEAIIVSFHARAAADCIDQNVFCAHKAFEVVAVSACWGTAESTAATLTLQVEKLTGTTAPGSGTELLSSSIDCKSTANTVNYGTLITTPENLLLSRGHRLAVDFSAAANELADVAVNVILRQVED